MIGGYVIERSNRFASDLMRVFGKVKDDAALDHAMKMS